MGRLTGLAQRKGIVAAILALAPFMAPAGGVPGAPIEEASLLSGPALSMERFKPAHSDYVVLQIPEGEGEEASRRLHRDLELAARDPRVARRVAEQYLRLARSAREPRYFGRAEALLRPWLAKPAAAAPLLVLQADILQNRHDFSAALLLLDRALEQAPQDARARLMRATVLMVRGDPASARTDCAALLSLGKSALGTICLAQSLSAKGQLEQAITMIRIGLSRGDSLDPATLAWAQASLADIASRKGDSVTAELHWRAALASTPDDEFIRCALSDLLIARRATAEALQMLDLPRPSVGILVRRVIAYSVSGEVTLRSASARELNELLSLEAKRGERVHVREETLLSLATSGAPTETLKLAQANFALQREPIDVRLLARAIVNARDSSARDALERWIRATGFKDRLVESLLNGAVT